MWYPIIFYSWFFGVFLPFVLTLYSSMLHAGRCPFYLCSAITQMSVFACGSHHVDTWPWNESIITPGKCFCLFIFSHLLYPVLRCSQVAPSLRECTEGQPHYLSLPHSFHPSDSHTHKHTHTGRHAHRLLKLFVTIIVRVGLTRARRDGEKGCERVMDPTPG